MFSTEEMENENLHPCKPNKTKFPEKMTIQINYQIFYKTIRNIPHTFIIKTNQNEYFCNPFGILASKTVFSYLESHPNSTEYYFDFNEDNSELQSIINNFNLESLSFKQISVNTVLVIAKILPSPH